VPSLDHQTDPIPTIEELKRKATKEESLDNEDTIYLLKAFKNDLVMRSPMAATFHDVPLRHFMFFLQDSKKAPLAHSTTMTEPDSKIHTMVVKTVELAIYKVSDINLYYK